MSTINTKSKDLIYLLQHYIAQLLKEFICVYLPLHGKGNVYQKMLQTFTMYPPVHYCCPVSLDTVVMCPRRPLADTDLPLQGVKTPQPLKHFLKDKLALVSCA